MSRSVRELPDPTPEAIQIWLKQIDRPELHEAGWVEANRRYHNITRAARPFLLQHFPDEKEREAAFDGLTLALMTLAHFKDLEELAGLFADQKDSKKLNEPGQQTAKPDRSNQRFLSKGQGP